MLGVVKSGFVILIDRNTDQVVAYLEKLTRILLRLTGNPVVDRRTEESRTVWRQRPRGTEGDSGIMVMKQQQSRLKNRVVE